MSTEETEDKLIVYTHNSSTYSRNIRESGFGVVGISFVCFLLFGLTAFLSPLGLHSALPLLIFPAGLCILLAVAGILLAAPWQLALDYSSRTFESSLGHRPFTIFRKGDFSEIEGVSYMPSIRYGHAIQVKLGKGRGKRAFVIESGFDADSAILRVNELATSLNAAVLGRDGKPVPVVVELDDRGYNPTYTQSSTRYGQSMRKSAVFGLVASLILCLTPWLRPIFDTTIAHDKALTFAIFMSTFFCVWPLYFVWALNFRFERWRLSLDFAASEYRLRAGSPPFVRQTSGSFDQLAGIRIIEMGATHKAEPYVVAIKFNPPANNLYLIGSADSRAEAEQLAERIKQQSGLEIVDAFGMSIAPYRDRFPISDVQTYSRNTLKGKDSRRRFVIGLVVKIVLPVVLTPLIFYNPIPRIPVGFAIVSVIAGGCWFLAIYSALRQKRWTLTLDYVNCRYSLDESFRPFERRRQGDFHDFAGLCVVQTVGIYSLHPYRIAIALPASGRNKYYYIEAAYSATEARRRADELAQRLGVSALGPPNR